MHHASRSKRLAQRDKSLAWRLADVTKTGMRCVPQRTPRLQAIVVGRQWRE